MTLYITDDYARALCRRVKSARGTTRRSPGLHQMRLNRLDAMSEGTPGFTVGFKIVREVVPSSGLPSSAEGFKIKTKLVNFYFILLNMKELYRALAITYSIMMWSEYFSTFQCTKKVKINLLIPLKIFFFNSQLCRHIWVTIFCP